MNSARIAHISFNMYHDIGFFLIIFQEGGLKVRQQQWNDLKYPVIIVCGSCWRKKRCLKKKMISGRLGNCSIFSCLNHCNGFQILSKAYFIQICPSGLAFYPVLSRERLKLLLRKIWPALGFITKCFQCCWVFRVFRHCLLNLARKLH